MLAGLDAGSLAALAVRSDSVHFFSTVPIAKSETRATLKADRRRLRGDLSSLNTRGQRTKCEVALYALFHWSCTSTASGFIIIAFKHGPNDASLLSIADRFGLWA